MASIITHSVDVAGRTVSRKLNVTLWIIQSLLAALFVLAGGMKLIMPLGALEQQAHMPGLFLKFIGLCEVLGAFGLILPGVFRIRTGLISLAALGLVIIMIGATVITMATASAPMAIMPFAVGVFSALVVYGRRQFATGRQPACLVTPEDVAPNNSQGHQARLCRKPSSVVHRLTTITQFFILR